MTDLPGNSILEVTIIGTGGGYGESIVIHLGYQNWIVIDSCIDPKTKSCLPLEYLCSIGVNVKTEVKLIICTHWHDDHIQGISKLLKSCESSVFSMTRANDLDKFLLFVGIDSNKAKTESSASSTTEIDQCFKIIKSRNPSLVLKGAEQDKLLFSLYEGELKASIHALSPSDLVINEFDFEISTLITEYGPSDRKVISHSPNEKSVALLINVNAHSILLGSDLELTTDNRKGWLCILDNCQCIKTKISSLFKIPHHGSVNGYHRRIWDELLIKDPIANLTPWNLGKKLPSDEMINVFLNHTDNLFITSLNVNSVNPKNRDHSITKAINKFNKTVREIKFNHGIIRSRINSLENSSDWQIELFGKAAKLTSKVLEN